MPACVYDLNPSMTIKPLDFKRLSRHLTMKFGVTGIHFSRDIRRRSQELTFSGLKRDISTDLAYRNPKIYPHLQRVRW